MNFLSGRQDEKSECSVKDKIAMFSSQANSSPPLFPVSNSRSKMAKHKSSETVFLDDKLGPKTPNSNGWSPEEVTLEKSQSMATLYRATSFCLGRNSEDDKSLTCSEVSDNSSVSRTNSLASSFAPTTRRSSLNELIEQRRKSISKLRGLVIPEKETVPVDQPIIDLPEIKSRDSILNKVGVFLDHECAHFLKHV